MIGTKTNCVLDNEPKEGSARTVLLRVKYGAKVVLLVGFIRQSEPAESARDIVAQALVTDYNPPGGWKGLIIWIWVFDPFIRNWILAKRTEDVTTQDLEVETYGSYSLGTEGDIMQYALAQNIATYAWLVFIIRWIGYQAAEFDNRPSPQPFVSPTDLQERIATPATTPAQKEHISFLNIYYDDMYSLSTITSVNLPIYSSISTYTFSTVKVSL